MTTIATSSLYSGTINGLNSLDLDTLQVTDINTTNIDGNYFSINTIEANDIQVDNELELTLNGFITIGKNTAEQVIITDTQIGYLDGVTSNIQNQINNITIDTTDIETRLIIAEGEIDTLQTDVVALETNVTTLQNDVTALDTRLTTAEGEIDTLQTNVTSIDTRLTTAEGNITTLQTNVTSIDTRLTTAEGEIDTLQTNVTSIDTRLTTAEGEIDTLQNKTQKLDANGNIINNIDITGDVRIINSTQDTTISNNCSSANKFDTNINLVRTALSNNFFVGMSSTSSNVSNFAIAGTNTGSPNTPEILMELSSTGVLTTKDGYKLVDDTGNLTGTISNFPSQQVMGIIAQTNLFLQSNNLIDCWTPNLSFGQLNGVNLNIRTDTANTYKSRIGFKDLTLFGGLGNQTNSASIELNGETQTDAFTPTLKQKILTNETNITILYQSLVPVGTIIMTAQPLTIAPPSGYDFCIGELKSTTGTYANLYALIGDTYRGNKAFYANNFYLPDLRQLFVKGSGQNNTYSVNSYATLTAQYQQQSVQQHSHDFERAYNTNECVSNNLNNRSVYDNIRATFQTTNLYDSNGNQIPSNQNETRPDCISLNYLIKY